MERGQFTFYASFYKAIRRIRSKTARADAYDAICAYALEGVEPELENMNDAVAVVFEVAMPVLHASRRRAMAGSITGASNKCGCSADVSQNKIKDKDKNKLKDKHNSEHARDRDFEEFWSLYPKQVGKEQARRAFETVEEPVSVLLMAVAQQKQSAQWTKDGGAFIPNPATWLAQKRWEDQLPYAGGVPYGATGRLGTAEKENIRRLMAKES